MRPDPWSGPANRHSLWSIAGITTAGLVVLVVIVSLAWDVAIADRIATTSCVVYGNAGNLEQDVDGQVIESSSGRGQAACSAERSVVRRILLPDRIVRTVNPTDCEP